MCAGEVGQLESPGQGGDTVTQYRASVPTKPSPSDAPMACELSEGNAREGDPQEYLTWYSIPLPGTPLRPTELVGVHTGRYLGDGAHGRK